MTRKIEPRAILQFRLPAPAAAALGPLGSCRRCGSARPWVCARCSRPGSVTTSPSLLAFPTVALVSLFFGAGPGILSALVCATWTLVPGLDPNPPDAGLQASIFLPAAILVALAASHFEFAAPTATGQSSGLVPRRDGVVWWLRLSMILATILPTAFYAFAAVYSYRSTFEEARLETRTARRESRRSTRRRSSRPTRRSSAGCSTRSADADDEDIRARERTLHLHLGAHDGGHRPSAGHPHLGPGRPPAG